jgi:hypothetical protein
LLRAVMFMAVLQSDSVFLMMTIFASGWDRLQRRITESWGSMSPIWWRAPPEERSSFSFGIRGKTLARNSHWYILTCGAIQSKNLHFCWVNADDDPDQSLTVATLFLAHGLKNISPFRHFAISTYFDISMSSSAKVVINP